MNRKNPAIKRIIADIRELDNHPSSRYHARPLEDNMFEWHFTIRGPEGSDFEGGIYHGRILLPSEYPFKPPNIVFVTRNGRFEVGTKICLSISAYHEETWQPAWGVRTMLEAIISFMPSEGAGAIGALDWTPDERKALARESHGFCCPLCGPVKSLLKTPEELGESKGAVADPEVAKQVAQLHMTGGNASPAVGGGGPVSSSSSKTVNSESTTTSEASRFPVGGANAVSDAIEHRDELVASAMGSGSVDGVTAEYQSNAETPVAPLTLVDGSSAANETKLEEANEDDRLVTAVGGGGSHAYTHHLHPEHVPNTLTESPPLIPGADSVTSASHRTEVESVTPSASPREDTSVTTDTEAPAAGTSENNPGVSPRRRRRPHQRIAAVANEIPVARAVPLRRGEVLQPVEMHDATDVCLTIALWVLGVCILFLVARMLVRAYYPLEDGDMSNFNVGGLHQKLPDALSDEL